MDEYDRIQMSFPIFSEGTHKIGFKARGLAGTLLENKLIHELEKEFPSLKFAPGKIVTFTPEKKVTNIGTEHDPTSYSPQIDVIVYRKNTWKEEKDKEKNESPTRTCNITLKYEEDGQKEGFKFKPFIEIRKKDVLAIIEVKKKAALNKTASNRKQLKKFYDFSNEKNKIKNYCFVEKQKIFFVAIYTETPKDKKIDEMRKKIAEVIPESHIFFFSKPEYRGYMNGREKAEKTFNEFGMHGKFKRLVKEIRKLV